ncbi:hypothetical protein [Virgisporangium aurantiacum]|uniref:Uncharacterized protein n=1 Tax=Virgisporangium aurantiacum TaxID=175570 RepID=A0A8J3ZDM8_9ACTN|nr:hypothetical protein [Virgisporangium aurantiacum]GIJ62039.1 hypothetical protein Vau01_095550 [Virgisporangium aurantiacum]
MSTQPDEPDEPAGAVPERWVYGGIRVLDGKRVHAWIDPSGRELLYSHKRGRTTWAIGSLYTAEVSRHDGTTRLHNKPTYTGEQTDDVLRRRLRAADTAARAQLARLAQERNDARSNAIDDALDPVLAVARTLKSGPDRDAFTAYLLRRILSAWYTPPTPPEARR